MKIGYIIVAILLAANIYQFAHTPLPEEGEVVLVADREYFSVARQLIENANTSVRLIAFNAKYYSKYPDSKTNVLLDALAGARDRGVDVRVVVDEFDKDARNVVNMLRARGIDARLDGADVTTHAKVLVVDDYVLIGSTNWSFTSFEKNHEANVLVRSRGLAKDMERYFDSL
ncbi:MAG: hypothetical protein HY366_00540 [Candidatus Aenigmarchaeota archaeon]|nr:hypothetical protein [Candidatus Aenigmarchaeota archaeon]